MGDLINKDVAESDLPAFPIFSMSTSPWRSTTQCLQVFEPDSSSRRCSGFFGSFELKTAKLFLEDKLTIPKCLEDDKCLQAGVSLNIHSFEKTPDVYLCSVSSDCHYNRLLSRYWSWPSHREHPAPPLPK